MWENIFHVWPNQTNSVQTWKQLSIIYEQILTVATAKPPWHLHSQLEKLLRWSTDQLICPENGGEIRISFT